jgi:hypothetical protein
VSEDVSSTSSKVTAVKVLLEPKPSFETTMYLVSKATRLRETKISYPVIAKVNGSLPVVEKGKVLNDKVYRTRIIFRCLFKLDRIILCLHDTG